MTNPRTSATTWRRRAISSSVVLSLLLVGSFTAQAPAWAIDYPTWAEVAAARGNEAKTKAQIATITSLISGLEQQVVRSQAEAIAAGEAYQLADQAFQEQAYEAEELQSDADAAEVVAEESMARAGAIIAQLYRSGNGDVTTTLLISPGEADDLLYRLGLAGKLTEKSATIYEGALQDQQAAQALSDQATVAKEAREQLRVEAEAALAAATAASEAAAAALVEQEEHKVELDAQLTVLSERRAATEEDYLAGERARAAAAAAAAAAQAAAEAAAAAAAAEAAAAAAAAAEAAGQPAPPPASGWVKPGGGRVTSPFGYRASPFGGGYSYHLGTDFAAGCGAPIFAAHSGTVSYSGWNGVYGNYIQISHGGGVATAYGHIQSGGLLVRNGQSVSAGQQIARAGRTGAATGCHIHVGVLINGVVTDPVPFLRNRGVAV